MQQNRNSLTTNLVFFGIAALVLIVLFFLVKGVITLLYKFAFVFLLISLIANYRVSLNYIKSIMDLLKREPGYGIGAILLSIVTYPVVFLVLMFRAVLSRGFGGAAQSSAEPANESLFEQIIKNRQEKEYTDYEEIIDDEIELKQIEKNKR